MLEPKEQGDIRIVTRNLLKSHPLADHMGLVMQNREQQIRQIMAYQKSYFSVLDNPLVLPDPTIPEPSPILNFNCFYHLKDVKQNHFQLHQTVKTLSETTIIYSAEHEIKLFNTAKGIKKTAVRIDSCDSIELDETKTLAAFAFDQKFWGLYSLEKQEFLIKKVLTNLVNCSYFYDHNTVIVGGNFSDLYRFDITEGVIKDRIPVSAYVNALDYNRNRKVFACAMDDLKIQIVSENNQDSSIFLEGHEDYNFCVKFLDDNLLATGGQDITTRIWDIRNPNKELVVIPGKARGISAFEYLPEQKTLFALEVSGYFHSLRFDGGDIYRDSLLYPSFLSGMSFTPSKNKLIVGIAPYVQASSGLLIFDVMK